MQRDVYVFDVSLHVKRLLYPCVVVVCLYGFGLYALHLRFVQSLLATFIGGVIFREIVTLLIPNQVQNIMNESNVNPSFSRSKHMHTC